MKKLFVFFLASNIICLNAQTPSTETKATINVMVMSNLKAPIENQEISFMSLKTKKVYSGISKKDGRFQVLIPAGDKYLVQYQVFTSKKNYSEMNIPNMEGVVAECKLTITPASKFTLENVFFDSGKATLKPESFIELDELVKYMMQKKSTVIEVSGHTDDVGNIEANLKLFNDRANSVKAYLIKKGIDATRVEAKGYGDTIPVTDNTTDEVKKKNRRTEVKIVTR